MLENVCNNILIHQKIPMPLKHKTPQQPTRPEKHWARNIRPGTDFSSEVLVLIRLKLHQPRFQIPQVEARKRCSRDLFTSSGRATALIDRHFWYTFLQQSRTRLTNTAILLICTSRFHWRFSGNWQEHICERNQVLWITESSLAG